MTSTQDGSRFSSADEALAPESPRWHLGALAALLLAVFSLLSLVSSAWLLAGIAAIVLALVALRSIAHSQGLFRGRMAASIGLCLSLFVVGLVASQRIYREQLLVRRSEQLAREWLDLVQAGKIEQAHHLTLPKSQRVTAIPLADYYSEQDHTFTFKHFQDQLEIKRLRGAAKPQITTLSSRRSAVASNSEQFTHQYEVLFPNESERLEVQVVTERSYETPDGWQWRIASSTGKLRTAR